MDWSPLPYDSWHDSLDTLHMWMQIVGKVKVVLCPFLNQWWETAFYVTPFGMTTGRIPYIDRGFSVDFDFIHHTLHILVSTGEEKSIPLRPMSVAKFYEILFANLQALDIAVSIYPIPSEIPDPIPFKKDFKHKSYDKKYVAIWWHILLQTSFVFDEFRSDFRGKSSPIQFFWGSFDLNGTRFSGKKVTPPNVQGPMGNILRLAENEENFAFGFWPGDKKFPHPAFYTYIYPAPIGHESIGMGPTSAYFEKQLSECILFYENVRKAKNPKNEILSFLTTTYTEYAKLAKWDIKGLESVIPLKEPIS